MFISFQTSLCSKRFEIKGTVNELWFEPQFMPNFCLIHNGTISFYLISNEDGWKEDKYRNWEKLIFS